MKCTNHPEREADGMCTYCGKPFCKECLVEVKGRMYCKNDIGNVIDEAKQQAANASSTINITNTNDNANTNHNIGAVGGFSTVPRKSKTTALILCLLGFVGLGGMHRIYVGKVGTGVLWFLTSGLCVIGTIIDLLSIISGGFRDSYGQPLA